MEHSHIRVIERSSGTIWASYPKHQISRGDLPAKIILLPEKSLCLPAGVKWISNWQFMPGHGPVKVFSAHLPNGVKIQNLAWKTLFPSKKNWDRRGHLFWQKQSRLFIFEEFTPNDKVRPIDLRETSINSDEHAERIPGLVKNYLSFIEKREDGSSTLFQDPKDGRYFKHLAKDHFPSMKSD